MQPAYIESIGDGSVLRIYAMRVCKNEASIRPETLIATAPTAIGSDDCTRLLESARRLCGCGARASCAGEMPSPRRSRRRRYKRLSAAPSETPRIAAAAPNAQISRCAPAASCTACPSTVPDTANSRLQCAITKYAPLRPNSSFASASITCETVVGVMLRSPS